MYNNYSIISFYIGVYVGFITYCIVIFLLIRKLRVCRRARNCTRPLTIELVINYPGNIMDIMINVIGEVFIGFHLIGLLRLALYLTMNGTRWGNNHGGMYLQSIPMVGIYSTWARLNIPLFIRYTDAPINPNDSQSFKRRRASTYKRIQKVSI